MNKLDNVVVKVVFEYNYTDAVNQAIEDNQFEDQDDLELSLRDWIQDDITEDVMNNPDWGGNIEFDIE